MQQEAYTNTVETTHKEQLQRLIDMVGEMKVEHQDAVRDLTQQLNRRFDRLERSLFDHEQEHDELETERQEYAAGAKSTLEIYSDEETTTTSKGEEIFDAINDSKPSYNPNLKTFHPRDDSDTKEQHNKKQKTNDGSVAESENSKNILKISETKLEISKKFSNEKRNKGQGLDDNKYMEPNMHSQPTAEKSVETMLDENKKVLYASSETEISKNNLENDDIKQQLINADIPLQTMTHDGAKLISSNVATTPESKISKNFLKMSEKNSTSNNNEVIVIEDSNVVSQTADTPFRAVGETVPNADDNKNATVPSKTGNKDLPSGTMVEEKEKLIFSNVATSAENTISKNNIENNDVHLETMAEEGESLIASNVAATAASQITDNNLEIQKNISKINNNEVKDVDVKNDVSPTEETSSYAADENVPSVH